MSDIIKLNMRSKNIKAVVQDQVGFTNTFTEFPEVIEREKQEQAHKLELENEFKRGYESGKSETTEIFEQKHSEDLLNQSKDFYNIIATFEKKLKDLENDYHNLVIKVSERIASKIIQKEIEIDSTIKKILEQNLRRIIGANDVIIKLNPNDYKLVELNSNEYLASSGITKVRFESNENIQIGGCLIESEIGNVDARIEAQIDELIRALDNHFSKVEIE